MHLCNTQWRGWAPPPKKKKCPSPSPPPQQLIRDSNFLGRSLLLRGLCYGNVSVCPSVTPGIVSKRLNLYVKRYECKYGNRPKKTDPSRSTFQGHSRSSNRHGSIGYTWHPTSAWFAVTVGLSRTVSQIKGDFYRNQRIFLPRVFNATQRGFFAEFCNASRLKKL